MANEVRLIDANKLPITTEFFDDGEYSIDFVYASAIRQAPTIDPESLKPKGRWVYDEKNMEMACSECLCAAHVRCGDRYDYILSDYCPNCGAKMMEG